MTQYWTNYKGIRIRLSDLTNEHLIAIIKMLDNKAMVERFKAQYELTNKPAPVNKQSQKLLTKEIKRVAKINGQTINPLYNSLVKERKKRNLK